MLVIENDFVLQLTPVVLVLDCKGSRVGDSCALSERALLGQQGSLNLLGSQALFLSKFLLKMLDFLAQLLNGLVMGEVLGPEMVLEDACGDEEDDGAQEEPDEALLDLAVLVEALETDDCHVIVDAERHQHLVERLIETVLFQEFRVVNEVVRYLGEENEATVLAEDAREDDKLRVALLFLVDHFQVVFLDGDLLFEFCDLLSLLFLFLLTVNNRNGRLCGLDLLCRAGLVPVSAGDNVGLEDQAEHEEAPIHQVGLLQGQDQGLHDQDE